MAFVSIMRGSLTAKGARRFRTANWQKKHNGVKQKGMSHVG